MVDRTQIASCRSVGRSARAIVAGLGANILLSTSVDQVFHFIGVYPPWGMPMEQAGDNMLALSYRVVIGVISGYVAARLAPHRPVTHAIILGMIGTALGLLGLMVVMQNPMGPTWYPVLLAAFALPSTWLGGKLFVRRAGAGPCDAAHRIDPERHIAKGPRDDRNA
jgi:uncharacterized membrane protein YeaQ/YmgE (transglycosylase-associated protein family)